MSRYTGFTLEDSTNLNIDVWRCKASLLRYAKSVSDVTRILEAAQQVDPKAADQLLPLVYDELRRILIDRARRKQALRHGGDQQRVDLQEVDLAAPDGDDQLLAVSEAVDKLAVVPRIKVAAVTRRALWLSACG